MPHKRSDKKMESEYEHDVFISYSRHDYIDDKTNEVIDGNVISVIKDTFDKNGISFWMDEKGNLTGKKFAHIIAGHIRGSMVFLFVCSKNSVASKWVDRELSVADALDKHIIPLICDESFTDDKVIMFTTSLDRIEYFKHPKKELDKLIKAILSDKNELEEKKRAEEERKLKERIEEEEKRKKLEEEKRKKETIEEIKRLAEDHRLHSSHQAVLMQQLVEKNNAIGNITKSCPVCGNTSSISSSFCEKCGFQFPQLYAVDGNDSFTFDNKLLSISKANHDSLRLLSHENERMTDDLRKIEYSMAEANKKVLEYQRAIEEINSLLASKENEISELKTNSTQVSEYYLSQITQLEEEKKDLQGKLSKAENELNELKNHIKQKEKELDSYRAKTSSLSNELDLKNKQIVNLKKEQTKQKKELQDCTEKLQQENTELTKRIKQHQQEKEDIEQHYKATLEKIQILEEKLTQLQSQANLDKLYDVVLLSPGKEQLAVAKFIKETLNIGLKEAYDLVISAPYALLSVGVTMNKAEKLAKSLNTFGASYKITPHNHNLKSTMEDLSSSVSNNVENAEPTFQTKSDVFEFVRRYTKYPSSLKKTDKISVLIDKTKFCTDLEASYGISIWTRIPQTKTIGNLVDTVWKLHSTNF